MQRSIGLAVAMHVAFAVWIAHERPSVFVPPSEPLVEIHIEETEPVETNDVAIGADIGTVRGTSGVEHARSFGRVPSSSSDGPEEGLPVILTSESAWSIGTNDIHHGFALEAPPKTTETTRPSRSGPPLPDAHQSIMNALLDHDREVGMGAEGPVVNALETATYGGFAPVRGSAVFEVAIGRDGIVTSIRTQSPEWNDVAVAALENVKGKPAHVPHSANGISIKIEITSKEQLASGHAAPKGAIPKALSTASSILLLEPGDLAPPQRVVSGRVLAEQVY